MRTIGYVLGLTLLTLGTKPASASGGTKGHHAAKGGLMVQVLTRDGKTIEGDVAPASLDLAMEGKVRKIALRDVLSIRLRRPCQPRRSGAYHRRSRCRQRQYGSNGA